MLSKIEIFENFVKIDIFRILFYRSRNFLKILTKIENFDPNQSFSEIFANDEIFQIFTLVEIFKKICPKSRFSENLDQNQVIRIF